MVVKENRNGSELILFVEGRMDTSTAPVMEKIIDNGLDGITDLIIDFSGLDYTSSSGLRVLLKAQKKMNKQGSMKVVNVSTMIKEILDITGFSDILTIE